MSDLTGQKSPLRKSGAFVVEQNVVIDDDIIGKFIRCESWLPSEGGLDLKPGLGSLGCLLDSRE